MGHSLFDNTILGSIEVKNRVAMAPMTRARAPSCIATSSIAAHYAQRAGAGLIITEASQISAQGTGSVYTPGIYTPEMVEGWRLVTDAVHAAGGKIVAQIWHVGRVSHTSFHNGDSPVSSSATSGAIHTFTKDGYEPASEPRALEEEEIGGIVKDFAKAASNAIDAGFDGVQIHGANGYLIDQFLRDGVNKRQDSFGGEVVNRCRFPLQVVDACCNAIGSDRVALRLSPFHSSYDCADSDPVSLFLYLAEQLNSRDLAFVDIVERGLDPAEVTVKDFDFGYSPKDFREIYKGSLMVNGQYDLAKSKQVVEDGFAQMVGIGRPYLGTPDVAERWKKGAELNPELDIAFWYGGDDTGYTDQVTL